MTADPLHLVSDFNIDLLASGLRGTLGETAVITIAPFGQVYQALIAPDPAQVTDRTTLIVWTRPESVVEGFRRALQLGEVEHSAVLAEVDRYTQALLTAAASCRYVLHPTWTIPASKRLYGLLDLKPGLGIRSLLVKMNQALSQLMEKSSNIFVLDAESWLRTVGAKAYAPKLEFITKTPFSPPVFAAASKDIIAALDALEGRARKIVVVDLDNTLWGGVVGDDGPDGIHLGGHEYIGEAYAAFQRSLLALTNRGIQLAIASKNDESLALEVIDSHPEMILRREHFAGWRINWNDKAANLVELSQELRLGLQSFVFIDDNPVERSRISSALPEVLVPEWPAEPALYAATLDGLDCFDVPQITPEDFARTATHVAERQRRASQSGAPTGSFNEWLDSLETSVQVEPLSPSNLPRVGQLFNKTNQLNLTTRRLSATEIDAWASDPGRKVWAIRVRDRFGDSGLTGVVSLEIDGPTARLADLILSCRVMGRGVEYAMLHLASAFAASQQVTTLEIEYRRTERNGPCLKVLQESALSRRSDTVFVWEGSQPYPLPPEIRLVQ
ncbi:MAG: HAD-IIIC family phosphatase [Acidobacteriota bacterium]